MYQNLFRYANQVLMCVVCYNKSGVIGSCSVCFARNLLEVSNLPGKLPNYVSCPKDFKLNIFFTIGNYG